MAAALQPKNPNVGLPGEGPKEITQLGAIWRRFKRNKLALVGICVLILLYIMAALAPQLATHAYDAMITADRYKPPSSTYWLGTDHLGRDIWSRIVWGSRISLAVGFVSAGLAVTIGTILGSLAGYYRGRVDSVISRVIEIFVCIPQFFLLLTVMAVVERSIFNIMLIIGLTSWPGVARIVRGEFFKLRELDFSQASRALGAKDIRIIFKHILPNAMAPIIVSTTLRIGGAILTESSLSYLGFGTPPPFPSWGSIAAGGKDYLRNAPWIAMAPGFFIFVTVLSFNFIGDALRDALDPKLKR
jgi:peptide/nickel transport system permease protein